ncbi:hypothetical protein L1987_74702 [Smallanthus sonchifolius]|uniref:Uncharacterized protein n=1 Tax=Smallanthus sonchifolius TaxID=185202 RepID=A0ACB9A3A9_9ASTR|nr:hypothetical protein L1987_74702 [Smallanthus sonchifolius]
MTPHIVRNSQKQSDVKFTYGKLLQQEDEGHTNIRIVSPSSSKARKQFMDLKSLSMALPRERKTISFIKEEVVQEAGNQR